MWGRGAEPRAGTARERGGEGVILSDPAPIYATAVLIDEASPCGLWPECGCDQSCAGDLPEAEPPTSRLAEIVLLGSILVLGGGLLLALIHHTGGIHAWLS
jgi:hypothetical protein